MDLHLVVEPVMPCGIQLFGIDASLEGAYVWPKVPQDVFPGTAGQQIERAVSLELLTSTSSFAALTPHLAQRSKEDNRM